MNLYVKDLEAIGFKSNDLLGARWSRFYYIIIPESMFVYIVDILDEIVMHFELSKTQFKKFNRGDLSLVPIGCCNPTGRLSLEDPIVDHRGDFKKTFGSKRKFLNYLQDLVKVCT